MCVTCTLRFDWLAIFRSPFLGTILPKLRPIDINGQDFKQVLKSKVDKTLKGTSLLRIMSHVNFLSPVFRNRLCLCRAPKALRYDWGYVGGGHLWVNFLNYLKIVLEPSDILATCRNAPFMFRCIISSVQWQDIFHCRFAAFTMNMFFFPQYYSFWGPCEAQ